MVSLFVVVKLENIKRYSSDWILTSLVANSIVIRKRTARIRVKITMKPARLSLSDRFNRLLLLCNACNWLEVRFAADVGPLVDAWENRGDGRSPLRRAVVVADNEE